MYDIDAKTAQTFCDIGSCAHLLEGCLRVRMNMPAPLGHLRQVAPQLLDRFKVLDGAHGVVPSESVVGHSGRRICEERE